ncbi:MAG: pteridine reductase [Steroidobacteraceae bacterium]
MASIDPLLPLSGRAVVLTGGARRVGAALARAFHGAGANLFLHYRGSRDEAAALSRELTASRPNSVALVQADLLDTARLPRLIEEAHQAFGRVDVLLNNASSFYPTPIGEITEEAWEDLIGTNVKAPLFLSQAAAPALRAARGLILNIADIHGTRPLARYPVYSTAKAALIMLTKVLARELAPEVRVNAIAPGPVLWAEDADRELQEKIIARTLLKRAGSPEDVARAALFFATDAPYVTGQVLAIDGGRSLAW